MPERVGVTHHDTARAYTGYTLFSFARGLPQAVLIDMDGHVVHSWVVPGVGYLARLHLFENGDLLVLTWAPYGIMRIDSSSKPIWGFTDWPHHDFQVLPDGQICALIRSVTTRDYIESGAHLIDDHVVLLDSGGRELKRASLLEAFENSERWSGWVSEDRLPHAPDVFHSNSVGVISSDPELRVLLSIRSPGALAIINVDRGVIEGAMTGDWHMQHEARFVGESILLFDNLGLGDRSRVIEIDPTNADILWTYESERFFSKGAGAQQRLANGNTLITESNSGRILEVTRSGDAVWEYVNPLTSRKPEPVVLGIMRAERLPVEFPVNWARPGVR